MDKFWIEFLQAFLAVALPTIAVALFRFVWALGSLKFQEFKKQHPNWGWAIEEAAVMAVHAAEQAGAAGYINDKKGYAIEMAQRQLKLSGVPLDLTLLDAQIEAAVWSEINKDKQKPADQSDQLNKRLDQVLPY